METLQLSFVVYCVVGTVNKLVFRHAVDKTPNIRWPVFVKGNYIMQV